MQAILKPISHPELGDLVIDGALFNVGRDSDAFSALPAADTVRLSRRHARLFEQDGVLYILDLGSRNGTSVNGEPIATQPHILKSGDLIDFAGNLAYRLDVTGKGKRQTAKPPGSPTLQLVATFGDKGPDSLVVSAFPFLISKYAEAFIKYQERVPEELNYLSRRHAHIYNSDGRLLLEDLGSTNGTFVDSQRLGELPVELHDGQAIAFGGDYFVYRVVLVGADDAASAPAPPEAAPRVDNVSDKTTFVTAATSFLDIFCADAEADGESTPADNPSAAGTIGRPRSLGGQLIEAFGGAAKRVALIVVALIAAAAAGIYWAVQPSVTDRVQSLVEEQRFNDALALARTDTAIAESGSLIARLGLRALIAKTLPDWLDALDGQGFDAMAAVIAASRIEDDAFVAGREYLDLLAQIGEIQATLAARGGLATPFRWFDDEPWALEQLIDKWQRPQPDKRQVSERVLGAASSDQARSAERLREAYRRTASDVRALASRLAVYRPAQRQMSELLRRHIEQGTLDRLTVELEQLAKRYKQFSGVSQLRDDLAQYRAIVDALAAKRLMDAARRVAEASFHATPFADAVAQLARDQLPSADFLAAYDEATTLWQKGQVEAARTRLAALQTTPWRGIAERELARIRQVAASFDALQAQRGSDAYNERLLAMYQGLDERRDQFFAQQLAADYAQARRLSAQRAEQAAAAAAAAWNSYGESNGITSTLRLASRAGKAYSDRAAALSTAATEADRARRAYTLAGVPIPEQHRDLLDAIDKEAKRQHQSLDELQGVLDRAVLLQKRALLPERRP